MMAMLRSLLLLFMMFSMGNAGGCRYGWTMFGHRCYKFFPDKVDWATAERTCQYHGANLASIHNGRVHHFLLSLAPGEYTYFWIGGHDAEKEGLWLWTDGSLFDYSTHWCSGQPDNYHGRENCLHISYNTLPEPRRCWNDLNCSEKLGYICASNL